MLYFDIGANVGKWTIANHKKDTKVFKVVVIEALSKTYDILCKNCNNRDIICLNYGGMIWCKS